MVHQFFFQGTVTLSRKIVQKVSKHTVSPYSERSAYLIKVVTYMDGKHSKRMASYANVWETISTLKAKSKL